MYTHRLCSFRRPVALLGRPGALWGKEVKMAVTPRPRLDTVSRFDMERRVTYQLIALDYRHNPALYTQPFDRVLELAYLAQFPPHFHDLTDYLFSLGKALLCGYTARQWRDELVFEDTGRRLRKRHFHLPGDKRRKARFAPV